jgi:hypothetical protein
MQTLGFNKNNEFLPSFDKFQTSINQRVMFLKFFNQEVCCDLKFTTVEFKACRKETLFNIFAKKIFNNLLFKKQTSSFFKIDVQMSLKINRFIKKANTEVKNKFSNYTLLNINHTSSIKTAVKLVDIFEESGCSLYLDGNKIFKNFVFNKILRTNERKLVDIHNDSIDIKSKKNSYMTKIFTFWEFISSNDLKVVDEHIKKAVECIKNSEYKQIYLVYPKNENFYKHIQVKTKEITTDEYEIKLIPYSIRSTLR